MSETNHAAGRGFRKVLLIISEDWFALSHFQPLITTLREIAEDVVVATRSSGRMDEIEALGARVIDFDIKRSSLNPLEQTGTVRQLARLIEADAPDVVHVVAMQPMVLTALALRMVPKPRVVMHLTGLGFIGISRGLAAQIIKPVAMLALRGVLKRTDTWLLAENPEDHTFLRDAGVDAGDRVTILPGAGIDPDAFPPCAPRATTPVRVAFAGRMIRSKGVEVLADASRYLREEGLDVAVDLYGRTDADNPECIREDQLRAWEREGLLTWHGHVSNVAEIWKDTDICVLPSISREGMPRTVLEAASSGRPLVVTDVPGSRHFVRPGEDGEIVPPNDAAALAAAIRRLATDAELRARMGQQARQRILDGYTIDHVKRGIQDAYAGLRRAPRT
ncbi:MAG: glycosyltransferase family 4 protein [Filomicrobium sp.]